MQLKPAEVERFYAIWKPLLLFVNRRLKLVSDMLGAKPNEPWNVSQVQIIRDAMWADDSLREAFITENPARLSADDLSLVASWKHRVAGSFAVLRHLKRYSIFIGENDTVYGVLGLASPLAEVTPFVPGYFKAVLLPFGDRIIYDSLLAGFNVYLGPGIRSNLERTYADARERGDIVTSLPRAATVADPKAIAASNAKVIAAFRVHLFGSGLSERVVGRDTMTVEELAQQLLSQSPPRSLRELDATAFRQFLAGNGDRTTLTGLRRLLRFLRDTDRMNFTAADAALAVLAGRE